MSKPDAKIASGKPSEAQAVDRIQEPIVRPSFVEHAIPAGMLLMAMQQMVQHPRGETGWEIAFEVIFQSAVAFALLCMAVGHIYMTISRHISRSNPTGLVRESASVNQHPVVGSPNSETPRVTNVLAGMVEPLAKANSSEEFTAALKDALQRLIAESKKLERENIRQDKMLENAFVLACERSRSGRIDRELYAVLGISLDGQDRTSNTLEQGTVHKVPGPPPPVVLPGNEVYK